MMSVIPLPRKMVPILFDEAKRIGENLEGIILFTPERLYFHPFEVIERTTVDAISEVISNAIKFLNSNGITVISACCDNASANVAAFNTQHSYTVQYRIGEGIIRIRCCAHSCKLASSDVYSKEFPGIVQAVIVEEEEEDDIEIIVQQQQEGIVQQHHDDIVQYHHDTFHHHQQDELVQYHHNLDERKFVHLHYCCNFMQQNTN